MYSHILDPNLHQIPQYKMEHAEVFAVSEVMDSLRQM